MLSLYRKYEYGCLKELELKGEIIDLGGSLNANYHNLINGTNKFTVINIDERYGYDIKCNLEEKISLADKSYDHAIAINLLEHVYNFKNLFVETKRILKPGGYFVLTSPFFIPIHGCPNDFNRFTKNALVNLCNETGFEVVKIKDLGEGIFSVIYQMTIGIIPTTTLKYILQYLCVSIDKLLKKLSKRYKNISKNYPLGYYILIKSNN